MMKIYKLNYLILSFLFIVSCGYQPLYSNKEANFYIYKINSFDNEKINKALINKLELYKDKNSNKKIELEKDNISIPGRTLKRAGKYEVSVRVHREVSAQLAFEIEPDE